MSKTEKLLKTSRIILFIIFVTILWTMSMEAILDPIQESDPISKYLVRIIICLLTALIGGLLYIIWLLWWRWYNE